MVPLGPAAGPAAAGSVLWGVRRPGLERADLVDLGLIGCYLCFPWILRGLTRLGPWSALALGIGGYLVANQLCWSLLAYPVYQMPMGYGFIRALPLFVLGMSLAWFAQSVWIHPRFAGWIGIAAFCGLVVAQPSARPPWSRWR